MCKIEIKNLEGATAGTRELNASVFGIEPNVHVLHTVVRCIQAAMRQGTHQTKTRGKVSGGGRKPWRQKGTGRARQGSTRSPQWRGGGTVFGPHPRSYDFHVNKKVVKLALRSALSAKLADGELTVVDKLQFEQYSTKQAAAFLKAAQLSGRTTLVLTDGEETAAISFRNLDKVQVWFADEVDALALIDCKNLIMSEGAVAHFEEALA